MTYSAFSNKLFEKVFGVPERKGLKLELYNALAEMYDADTESNADNIGFSAVQYGPGRSFCIGKKENLFLVHGDIQPFWTGRNLADNLALYMFLCASRCIEDRFTSAERCHVKNGGQLVRISAPHLIALYNGAENSEVPSVRFESNFLHSDSGGFMAATHIEDIRKNGKLAEKCRPLSDYASFMRSFCESTDAGTDTLTAISNAIRELPDGAVRQYLAEEKSWKLADMLSQN